MISKELFLQMLSDGNSHRKQFSSHSGVQKAKVSPTFSITFDCGLVKHFKAKTGRDLTWNPNHKQFYCFLRTAVDIEQVENWERSQGTRVFIRSLLDSTVALDTNFADLASGEKTFFGTQEEHAKYSRQEDAIEQCALGMANTIKDLEHLNGTDYICSIPASAEKDFDLPRELAKRISVKVEKRDISDSVQVTGKVKSAKDCSLEDKWDTWSKATLTWSGGLKLEGSKILLVDDKYQSGVTMHNIAAWFFKQGVSEVHGIAVVKTMRDTDNLDVIET